MPFSSSSGSNSIDLEAVCCNGVGAVRASLWIECGSLWVAGAHWEVLCTSTVMEAAGERVMANTSVMLCI